MRFVMLLGLVLAACNRDPLSLPQDQTDMPADFAAPYQPDLYFECRASWLDYLPGDAGPLRCGTRTDCADGEVCCLLQVNLVHYVACISAAGCPSQGVDTGGRRLCRTDDDCNYRPPPGRQLPHCCRASAPNANNAGTCQ